MSKLPVNHFHTQTNILSKEKENFCLCNFYVSKFLRVQKKHHLSERPPLYLFNK